MHFPYTDGLLEAKESNQPGWIAITWLYPGDRSSLAYRAFRKVEQMVMDQGFNGWLMASEHSHTNMHRHISKWGGVPYATDDRNVYFKKEMVS